MIFAPSRLSKSTLRHDANYWRNTIICSTTIGSYRLVSKTADGMADGSLDLAFGRKRAYRHPVRPVDGIFSRLKSLIWLGKLEVVAPNGADGILLKESRHAHGHRA
jgi:hypothetical protein